MISAALFYKFQFLSCFSFLNQGDVHFTELECAYTEPSRCTFLFTFSFDIWINYTLVLLIVENGCPCLSSGLNTNALLVRGWFLKVGVLEGVHKHSLSFEKDLVDVDDLDERFLC